MEIIEFEYQKTPQNFENLALCLGFFDALHLGHQALIKEAKKSKLKVGVLTFDEPPGFVLNIRDEKNALTSNADKAEYLEEFGVDYMYILHFDLEVSKLTRYEFIEKVLQVINPRVIYCGEDYTFGARGEGNPTYLSNYFDVVTFPLYEKNGRKVSSREIRDDVKNGEIKSANELLGRNYRMCGLVTHGLANGKKLGFPTANISPDYPYVMPKDGVYMGYGIYKGKKYKAMITVGVHPTISMLQKAIIEIHMIDFDMDIYGQYIYVEFVNYMRDNERFPSTDDLIEQLTKDRERVIKVLK